MKLDVYPRFILTFSLLLFIAIVVPSTSVYCQQTAKVFTGGSSTVGGYLEHLPDDYNTNPTKRYPILIFFHGVGEVGNGTTQIWSVTANGPPKLVQNGTWPSSFLVGGQTYKFIVISPQCTHFWQAADVDYAVEQIKTIYGSRIDPTRIYLTGLSGGGGGLWDYLAGSKYFGKDVAGAVICCGASWWVNDSRVNTIVQAGVPIWAFHNQYDPTVPESNSSGWYNHLNAAGIVPPMKYTMYAGVSGHDCWTATYDPSPNNPNQIYSWMLGNSRTNNTTNNLNPHPLANAGGWQTISLPSTVTLNGYNSTAIGATLVSYFWEKVNGPSGDQIQTPSSVNTVVHFTQAGVYTYQITVTDSYGNSNIATTIITVNGSSTLPIPNPGISQTVTLPSQATLDGSGSTDASGTITSYSWTKVSGPTGDNILSSGTAKTNISFTIAGTYVYQLTVKDNNSQTASATVTVTVNAAANQPPVANAGVAQTVTLPSQATLDGSGSTDASGTITSYSWTKVSGPTGDNILSSGTAKTNISFTTAGTYVYQLTVKDNNSQTASATVTVTVNAAANQPPVANAGVAQTVTLPSQATLDGSGSTDASGTITSYSWTKVSGPTGDNILSSGTAKTNISFTTAGTYVYQLTVKDNNSQTASSLVMVTVNNPTLIFPKAIAGLNQTLNIPNRATLNGSSSKDSIGTIVAFLWKKLSGPSGDTLFNPNASITQVGFMNPGIYNYRLTILDNQNLKDSAQVSITVNTTSPVLKPSGNAGNSQTIILPSRANLDASASTAPGSFFVGWYWVKLSGPVGDTIFSPNSVKTQVGFKNPGTYYYKVQVTDNNGNASSADVEISVNLPSINKSQPFAVAGNAQTVILPNGAILDGSGSYDNGGKISIFQWSKIVGPSGDLITSPDSAKTSISFSTPGNYGYNLVVIDNNGNTNSAIVNITVNPNTNIAPNADAGFSSWVNLPAVATIDGSKSYANSGTLLSSIWTKVSGPSGDQIKDPSALKTQINFIQNGTYVYQLLVKDSNGLTATSLVNIYVVPSPIAIVQGKTFVNLPSLDTLDGSQSSSPGGNLIKYHWYKISGPNGDHILTPQTTQTSISFINSGTYVYKLVVIDVNNDSSSSEISIIVNGPSPKISSSYIPVIVFQNPAKVKSSSDSLLLDASKSYSQGGPIIFSQWTLISGPSAPNFSSYSGLTTRISNFQQGNYIFKLSIRDSIGDTISKTLSIQVAPFSIPPIITRMQFYPNPVSKLGTLLVDNQINGIGNITVFDIEGRLLFKVTVQKNSGTSKFDLDFGSLNPGIYLIQYQMPGVSNTMRFIKQ